jgi:hypothetical protein
MRPHCTYQLFGGTCYVRLDDESGFNPEMEAAISPEKLVDQQVNAIYGNNRCLL